MEKNELVVKSEIIQPLEIRYNKQEIETFINAVEDKYKGVIVSESEIFQAKETISKINKIIATLKNYRIDNTKRAMRPLESFTNDFKEYEKRLEIVYREAKNQIDEFDAKVLKEQFETMQKIKENLCKEQEIEEKLIQYIALPEQKNELSKSKFNEKKATELIQANINKVLEDFNLIKTTVDNANNRSNINLNATNYIKYIDNMTQALQEILNDENKYLEMQKRIQVEEERKAKEKIEAKLSSNKPQNEAENDLMGNNIPNAIIEEKEANLSDKKEKVIHLLITLSQKEIKKALALKNFLNENNIRYCLYN